MKKLRLNGERPHLVNNHLRATVKHVKLDGLTIEQQFDRMKSIVAFDKTFLRSRQFADWALKNYQWMAVKVNANG